MSTLVRNRRLSVRDFRKGKDPFVCLTAYTTPVARLLDPHVDLLLVGDSLGMVLYGMESTLPVTLDMMIAHGAAVMRGSSRACVIVPELWIRSEGIPFGPGTWQHRFAKTERRTQARRSAFNGRRHHSPVLLPR